MVAPNFPSGRNESSAGLPEVLAPLKNCVRASLPAEVGSSLCIEALSRKWGGSKAAAGLSIAS
jgi:hypothetical protein